MRVAMFDVSHWHVPLYVKAMVEQQVGVVAVSDPDSDVARAVAGRLGCAAYTDREALLAKERPDYVFAFGVHREMPRTAERLMRLGIPFAMEKPMGVRAADLATLRAVQRETGCHVSVPLVFPYGPLFRKVEALRSSGAFGDPTNLYFRFIAGPPSRYPAARCAWMLDPASSGGGCTINLAVHFIDLALRLVRPRKVLRAYAALSNLRHGAAIEDFSTAVLDLEGGVVATVETGYAFPPAAGRPRDLAYMITTSKGYLDIRDDRLRWTPQEGAGLDEPVVADTDPWYADFVRESLDAIRSGRPPMATVDDLHEVMRVVDAIYRSGSERRPVEIA